MKCPRCQMDNPENARFCMNCGQALARRCSNCQSELPPGARFCMACGQPVLEQTPVDVDRLSKLTASAPNTLQKKIRSAAKSGHIPGPGSLGEKRTVTAMIVDVVGSTRLAERLDLETWTQTMNGAFDRVAQIIFRYEGTIVRLLGDSLLAFFGAPIAHEDDPQRAVRAGLDIIERVKSYARDVKTASGLEFAVRACINTGPVVIGPVGDDMRFEYTAFGGTVNMTSRIKFAGPPMSLLVTGSTYRFIAPYFECEDLGIHAVKGLQEGIQVYRVQSARATLGRVRGFADLESPMVGRDSELNVLLGLCDVVRLGLGRAVVLVGETGLGKTRLIQEWETAAKKELNDLGERQTGKRLPPGRWVRGRCSYYGQGNAYQLVAEVLKDLLEIGAGSDEPTTHEALIRLTKDLFGEQMITVYPYLAHMLSLKLDGEALERTRITDPQALQMQYLMAVERVFKKCTELSPLVLILEDLHWADASSIEIFTKLLPLVSHAPILFCLVTRPERAAAGWRLVNAARELLGRSLTEITLQSLSIRDTRSLVANLLNIESLPENVRDLILRKAEGNPFYVEEVIRMLIERGTIVNQDGAWIARQEVAERDIPDNLHGLLQARIDRLPAEARYTLLVASVIGRSFPVRVLAQVMGGAQDEPAQ